MDLKQNILIILLIIILIIIYINYTSMGIRNNMFNNKIICYFILDGIYDKERFIKILKSYNNFNVIDNNESIIVYHSNIEILNFKIESYINNFKINIRFNHVFFDMNAIISIINTYLENNINEKKLTIYKKFYKNDILYINFLYSISNLNKKYKYKKISFNKKDINAIQKKSKIYISKVDIIMSLIIKMYLSDNKKEKCNIIIIKSNNKDPYYIGNPIILHYTDIHNYENNIDIAYQIRNSYKDNKINLLTKIDIVINSWIPSYNYENKIKEINIDNYYCFCLSNYHVLICMDDNNYIINLYYI